MHNSRHHVYDAHARVKLSFSILYLVRLSRSDLFSPISSGTDMDGSWHYWTVWYGILYGICMNWH